jgi:hypothetical protein
LQSFASDTYAVTTSNVISTRITNLPQPNLTPYRLITDSYTQAQIDTKDTNNSNVISLRINALPPPQNYVLPVATASISGGIKVGANLTITNGILAGATPYSLPSATASIIGGIRVGTNLSISGDVLSGLAPPNLAPYRLITDSYTQAQIDTKDTNNSNVISTRINNTVSSQWTTSGANISYNLGNVGIANTDPTYNLSVGTYTVLGSDGIISIGKNNGSTMSRFFTIKYNSAFDMCFSDLDNKEVLRLSYGAPAYSLVVNINGNVGIGVSNPSQKLTVQGNTLLNGILYVAEPTGSVAGVNNGSIIIDHENSGGASSITFRSKVNRTSDFGYIQYQDASVVGGAGESARLIIGVQNDGDDHICLMPSGNVGIGTSTPATKLYIEGDLAATGSISSFYSDERLKEDIKKIESPLNIIENLKGFYYKPNELAKSFGIKNDKREIGLSAQDVKRVLPEIVSLAPFDISRDSSNNIVSKSGEDYLTICYERMIPVIVEAIKELNNEIKELKKVNKELMENK